MTPVFVLTFQDVIGLIAMGLFLIVAIPMLIYGKWQDCKRRKKRSPQ